ncbi:MAG: hypothetical protein ABWK05_09275 [Pyrobaculum sp.]
MRYILLSAILYAASMALGLAGLTSLSTAASTTSIVLIGVVLSIFFKRLKELKTALGERVAQIWLGGEYEAAIWLFVLAGVGFNVVYYFLSSQLSFLTPPTNVETTNFAKFAAIGALALGLFLLIATWAVATVYLMELFNRDLYLIQIAANVYVHRPHSTTLYVVLSVITLGFLYYYWLYSTWKWISQLTSLTKSPPS